MIVLESELAQRRRDRAATRALEHRSRLAQATAKLGQTKALSDADRRRLARNIGRIAELRADRPKALLRKAFELWSERDEWQLELATSRWPKRLRYSRLNGEEQKSEPLSADGGHYLALAECLVECAPRGKLTAEHSYTHLMTVLLAQTSFDIAVEGAASVDLSGAVDVAKLGSGLAKKLISQAPELVTYFTHVEALGLTHARSADVADNYRQVSGFDESVFVLSGWDGFGAEGHLVGDAVYDEFSLTQHEGTGFLACCPKVVIAHVSYTDAISSLTVSAEHATQLDETAAALELRVAVNAGEAALRSVGVEWAVHLVALPGSSDDPRGISFALTLERLPPPSHWPSLTSVIAEHAFDRSLADLIDLDAWEADAIVSLLTEAEAKVLLLGGERAAQILGLRATPTELMDIATLANGLPPLTIMPHVAVPDAFSPLPITTIAGMLDRNLKFVAENEGILSGLVADAKRRSDLLAEHQVIWEQDYAEASARFDGDDA